MLNYVHAKIANLRGKNLSTTPVEVIRSQLEEKRALPIGRKEFDEWSDRIISGALVKADVTSQKFALAAMLLQLGSREMFREDGYFIAALRKSATDQTAQHIMKEIKDAQAARMKEAENQKINHGAVTPPTAGVSDEVLGNETV